MTEKHTGGPVMPATGASSVLLPIPGEAVDPPAKGPSPRLRVLQSREDPLGSGLGLVMRTVTRFTQARVTLLAAGTTYYLFLALFSVLTLAYGLSAALGAEQLSAYVTEAMSAAFPGLLGGSGVEPDELRAIAQATSVVGAVGLLYGATGAVLAASRSIHVVYGAPENTRNFVLVRVWALGWFLVLAPLVLLSFVSATFTANLLDRVLSVLGIGWEGPMPTLGGFALALTLALNYLVIHVMLSRLGGIRPPRASLVTGAVTGAVGIEVLKQLMALLLRFVVDKPQYGSFAAPIGIMFVLYLQSLALYCVAALTAASAERSTPRPTVPASSGAGDAGPG